MSKFRCTCGHVIVDQTDCLPYKAYIREDENTQKPVELLAALLAQYCDALQQGRGPAFVKDYLLNLGETWDADYYPDRPLPEVLGRLIFPFWNNYDRSIYECEQCGRLWVQRESVARANAYAPYVPESDTRHILWSRHNHNPYGYEDEETQETQ
jgi:hypothetical protein